MLCCCPKGLELSAFFNFFLNLIHPVISTILSSSHLSFLYMYSVDSFLVESLIIKIFLLFFISSIVLLNSCLYFLALVTHFLYLLDLCLHYFSPGSWFIFIIVTVNTFSGRFLSPPHWFVFWGFILILCPEYIPLLSHFFVLTFSVFIVSRHRLQGWSSSSFSYLAPGGWDFAQRLFCRLPVGGIGACPLIVELGVVPLAGQAVWGECLEAAVGSGSL